MNEKRKISLERANVLKSRITDYLEARPSIPKGRELSQTIQKRQAHIKKVLGATDDTWNDYKWQLKHRINSLDVLKKLVPLNDKETKAIETISSMYRWSVSPYYLSLIDPDNPFDPIKLMSIPTALELSCDDGSLDPMNEEHTNPAGSITRRYPDRLIINVTNECAMYCRHCQRRRNIGQEDQMRSRSELEASISYIRENKEIRDILITGGDPLTLSDTQLKWLLDNLRAIPHVEIIRIGSRTPVTLPQRITDELVAMLKNYHPLFINTHFNHPVEITEEAKIACEKLANAGIPLGNQAVHLNGVNNNKFVMRVLNHELLKIRVKPYYIFHAKSVKGTHHFATSIDDGIEIMEYLRGYTSGMAIPTYIVNAPGGKGKTPILPEYLISRGKDYFVIRTWEGEILKHENHPTEDIETLYEKLMRG